MGINLFVNVDPDLYDAVKEVSTLSGLSLRAIIEAMIAERADLDHQARPRVRAGWSAYRKAHKA